MTEFVILLPVFILIFAGVVNLGQLEQNMVETEIRSHIDTFERALEVQSTSLQDALGTDPHMAPATAGSDAIAQLSTRTPRQDSAVAATVTLAEERAYSLDGLAQSGHWGESFARMRGPEALGVRFRGLGPGAVTPTPEEILGRSHLSRTLLFDGPTGKFQGSDEVGDDQPVMQTFIDKANERMSMLGARGVVAANLRYGTVTGEHEDSITVGGRSFTHQSYYTLSVAPYVNSDNNGAWWDALRAVSVSRITLSSSHYDAYNAVFGYTGMPCTGNLTSPCNGLPDQDRDVPAAAEVPFTAPINYDKTTLEYMDP